MKKTTLSLLTASLTIATANAAIVSVNFTNNDAPRQVTGTSGAAPAANWNNLTTLTGTNLNDDSGSATSVDLVVSAGGNGVTTNNSDRSVAGFPLFEAGYRDNNNYVTTITLNDISAFLTANSATSYNVYAYYKSALSGDNTAGASVTGSVTTTDTVQALIPLSHGFVEAGNPDANYDVFTGLTADSTVVTFSRGTRDAYIVGIQIETVPVPEPSSTALLGLGGLALILRRRK